MVDKIMGSKGFGPLENVKRTAKPSAGNKAGSSDKVSFSSMLQEADKAQATKAPQESARAEKLQALKAQIDSGTYQPDLNKVASSLLPFIMQDS